MRRVLPWLVPLLLLGCRPSEPLEAWCADPEFDGMPQISGGMPCPEHVDRVPDVMKAGECGRFDVFTWVPPPVTATTLPIFEVRPDGSIAGVQIADREYGRTTCPRSEWDCMTRELGAVINTDSAPPICEVGDTD